MSIFPMGSVSTPLTLTADTSAVINPKIVTRKRVIPIAMRLTGAFGCYPVPTKHILSVGDSLQMRGPHTGAISTKVVNLHSLGDGADECGISPNMSLWTLTVDPNRTISVSQAAEPKPARIRLANITPESFLDRGALNWFSHNLRISYV